MQYLVAYPGDCDSTAHFCTCLPTITSRFGPWTIWPLDDWAHPQSIWLSQSVDLAHLIYFGFAIYLYFLSISIIIRRGFERFLVQEINVWSPYRPAHFPLFWHSHTLGQASLSKPLPPQMPSPCWFDKWNWLREPDRPLCNLHSEYSAPSYVAIVF